jgi:two-component system sensor histidine kinase KdpD
VGAGLTVVVLVTALRLAQVDAASVAAPLLLLDVVVVARLWGARPALLTAAAAASSYSYYFIPPMGFELQNEDDWAAFVIFIVTAVVAGELASRAERRAAEAQQGRAQIEQLYRQLQAAFDRASEAEAARRNEQLKAALLDALTHNLRTPLTAIKMAVTALISPGVWTSGSELSAEGRGELLQVIDEESDRLNRFIEGLTSADRHDASEAPRTRRESLPDIVRAGVQRADSLMRDHRVAVAFDDPLRPVSVDAPSIIEVLYMLLDNASKYSPPGSTIRVTASLAEDRFVRLVVSDEGPGIPPELRDRVFENFFRIPEREPSDPRRAGVGLGLPIARRLVEAQGGKISIQAGVGGRGTAVVLLLPVAQEEAQEVEMPDPRAMALG